MVKEMMFDNSKRMIIRVEYTGITVKAIFSSLFAPYDEYLDIAFEVDAVNDRVFILA